MEISQKTEPQYDSTFPLLDIYEKKIKILIQENMCTSMFFAALFTIDKNMKPK